MSSLTFKERLLISEVLEFDQGDIFVTLKNLIKYDPRTTRNIIKGACGIDVFSDPRFYLLNQQEWLEKIWDDESDPVAGQVLFDFLEYFFEHYPQRFLSSQRKKQFNKCLELAQRIKETEVLTLPLSNVEKLNTLRRDIVSSFAQDNPELCLDRLHTFATDYLREICSRHEIKILNDNGKFHPIHSLAGALQKFYRQKNVVESEFSLTAIRNSIDLFSKYNDIRNDKSFAHPNEILNKAEAVYAVQIMANTLVLIERIETLIFEKESDSSDVNLT